MWRFWTSGWGPRAWWYWFSNEGFPLWFARHLPKRLALWTFIVVYAHGCPDAPGAEYKQVYDAWTNQ